MFYRMQSMHIFIPGFHLFQAVTLYTQVMQTLTAMFTHHTILYSVNTGVKTDETGIASNIGVNTCKHY